MRSIHHFLFTFMLATGNAVSVADSTCVLIWDEQQPEQSQADGDKLLGENIAAHLATKPGLSITTARLDVADQGLSDSLINTADVLVVSFRLGHEAYPIYQQDEPLRVIENAVRWLPTKTVSSVSKDEEPTNAEEAVAQKAKADALRDEQYQAVVAKLSPEEQAWERVLQTQLGGFYLPIHKRDKIAGRSTAWDFVQDDPKLPRVLLIGDSVSRGYTQAVRKALAGKANVHRAPANCGPTASGIKNLDVWLGNGKWDAIHFNFGIHDRNTPIPDYAQRLEQIIVRMKQTGAQLVWATTTPIPDDLPKKQTAASIVERNQTAALSMKKHDIAIDDLFTAVTPHLSKMQNPNDVHFNSKGYDFLGETVAASIETVLQQKLP